MDIVIDANVLGHAANPNSDYFESALMFVAEFFDSDSRMALDDTGGNAPVSDTSHLYMEYMSCLPPGSISRSLLQVLTDTGRIDFFLRPPKQVWDACKQLVPRNHGDAIVLGIGASCFSKLVTSNDYDDFSGAVRRKAKKKLQVTILDSDEMVSSA